MHQGHPFFNPERRQKMPTRNTAVLQQILEALEVSEPQALARLERPYRDSLLAVAGHHRPTKRPMLNKEGDLRELLAKPRIPAQQDDKEGGRRSR